MRGPARADRLRPGLRPGQTRLETHPQRARSTPKTPHAQGIATMADHSASPSPKKKLYIETVGCQMNMLDSELVVARLRHEGYELTDDLDQADAILYNTCSVRQHAEDKIYSALGRIKRLKARRPELKVGVLGCMAQKEQEAI